MEDYTSFNCFISAVRENNLKTVSQLISSLKLSEAEQFRSFFLAVFHDRTEIVKLMLASEFQFLYEDTGKCPAFQLAVHNDNIEIIEILMEKGIEIDSSLEKSILYIATCHDNTKVIRLLLDQGVDILTTVRGPFSCVHIAVEKECLTLLEFLFKNKADVNTKYPSYGNSEEGDSLLQHAVEKSSEVLVELLLRFNVDVNVKSRNGATPLHIAAEKGLVEIADSLVKVGANIHAITTPDPNRDYFCEKFNENEEIKFFLNLEPPIVPCIVVIDKGVVPLQVAVMNNHESMVRYLLENKADVDVEDDESKSILLIAVEKENSAVIDLVLSFSPNVNATSNRQALNLALRSYRAVHKEILRKLLDYGFIIDPENADIQELLYDAVCLNQIEIVGDLLNKGGDVNYAYSRETDEEGGCGYPEPTLLHSALLNDYDGIIKLLISHGANVNATPCGARSPILYSIDNGNSNITKLLMTKGASVQGDASVFIAAVQANLLDLVKDMISGGVNVNEDVLFDQESFYLGAYVPLDTISTGQQYSKTALFVAAEKGNEKAVELLVQNGAIMNLKSMHGLNPLLVAVINGHYKTVDLLLKLGASLDPFYSIDSCGRSALHLAAEIGRKDIVSLLIRYGAEVDCALIFSDGMTPLFFSCKNSHFEVVDLLLTFGANIRAVDSKGRTPLFTVAKNGQHEMVKFLLDRGAELESQDDIGYSPLLIATTEGHLKCVNALLECGANIHHVGLGGVTALHCASTCCHVDIVKQLLKYGAKINAKTNELYTPLIIAAWGGYVDIVEFLLKAGANPNAVNRTNATPLFLASLEGHYDIVKLLLKFGARPDQAFICDDIIVSPVCAATTNNHVHIVETLIKAGVNNALCSKACSTAADENHNEIVELLLDRGSNLDPGPYFLNYAEKGNLKFIEALLGQGASIDITDVDGKIALHFAAEHGHLDMVKLLLNRGAQVNEKTESDETPLHFSAARGYLEIAKVLLLMNANIDSADRFNRTALFLAAKHGHNEMVNFLLESGANVNPTAESETDKTPLLIAAERGHFKIVEALLRHGARADAKDSNELTVLYFAVEFGHEETVEWLLEKCVNVDCQTWNGLPLILIAADRGHLQIVQILLKFGVPALKKDSCAKISRWKPQVFKCILDFTFVTKDYGYEDSADLHELNISPLFEILNNIDPFYLSNSGRSNYNKLAEILVYHTVKMEAANIYIKEGDLVSTVFSDESQINNFLISCKAEVERMKSECITDTTVSFYDILTASFHQVARYAKNCSIVQYFTSADHDLESKFPIYSSVIKGQFEKGRMGKELQDQATKVLFQSSLCENLPPNSDPVACIEEIVNFLNVKDLRNVDLALPRNRE